MRWVSKNSFSDVVDPGKGFFETPIEYRQFSSNLTLFCYYYIPYFTHKSRINTNLSSQAKWAGSDVTACPHMISFSNGCALIPQPEALENVSRVIIHYSNMKWERWSQRLHQNCLNNNKDSFVLGPKPKWAGFYLYCTPCEKTVMLCFRAQVYNNMLNKRQFSTKDNIKILTITSPSLPLKTSTSG